MMIPPVINLGYPPQTPSREEFVVLVEKRGWVIARYEQWTGLLVYADASIPFDWRVIPIQDVRCWMRQDGR